MKVSPNSKFEKHRYMQENLAEVSFFFFKNIFLEKKGSYNDAVVPKHVRSGPNFQTPFSATITNIPLQQQVLL